jgi:hypothetical protein
MNKELLDKYNEGWEDGRADALKELREKIEKDMCKEDVSYDCGWNDYCQRALELIKELEK